MLGTFEQPPEQLSTALAEREKLGSTGVGEGVAIPHARIRGLPSLSACLGRLRAGIDFHAIDGKPARLVLARDVVDEHDPIRIHEIVFEGNNEFDDRALKKVRHLDAAGRVHVYNGTGAPYLSTLDPIASTWTHARAT